jgi:SH3-like domain-containing protein
MIRALASTLLALVLTTSTMLVAALAHAEDCSSKDVVEYQASADLPKTAYLRFDAINLRYGPGTRHCVKHVAEGESGAAVEVLGEDGHWLYIEYQADRFWVHRGLLTR